MHLVVVYLKSYYINKISRLARENEVNGFEIHLE